MNISIKKRLNVGFTFAILLVLLVGGISFATFEDQYKEGELVKHTYQVINNLGSIQSSVVDMETGRRGFRSTNNKKFLEPYHLGLQTIEPHLTELKSLVKDNITQEQRAEDLKKSIDGLISFWQSLGEDASKYSQQKIFELTTQEKTRMDRVRQQLADMEKEENQLLAQREINNNESVKHAKWGLIAGILLILFTVILLITQILKEFINRQKAEDHLQNSNKQLSAVNDKSAERNWLLDGLAKVNDTLQGHLEVNELSSVVLDSIIKYIDFKAGALYVFNSDLQKLILTAGYALPDTAKKEYALSEGFVGQAATEKNPLIITDIPAKYATVYSGTVSIEPVQAVYASLVHNGELKGMIELLSFQPIKKQTIQLINLVSNNIAVAIHAVTERQKVLQLFKQVQQQKETLEHQQEELRQTNEELTVQSEVLQASEEELRVQEEELRQINAELKQKNSAVEDARQSLVLKAKELEESSKYKSEFLANMSHELRTPLNSVLILAKLLSENKDNNLTEKQVTHAKIIYKSGSDLLQLINDILDLSKIEAGKADLYIESVPVKDIVADLEQLFAVVADEKNIKYTVEVSLNVPEKIDTDKQKVEQILKNLLSNAFKFTPEKGEVKLQLKKISEEGKDYLAVSVVDTGVGIETAKQRVIFEAFQQADGSTNRKYGGTGLGLSITKELTRILSGKLSVKSDENNGSTFTVLLPLNLLDDDAASISKVEKSKALANSQHVIEQTTIADERFTCTKDDRVVLIIEDDKDFALIIKEFAKSNGYKSIIALAGDEGLYCAKKYRPSAIILDLTLPGINGSTLLKIFKEDEQLKHIPVHVISASEDLTTSTSGALAHLQKPVQKEQLNNAFSLISEYLKSTIKRVLIYSKNNLTEEVYKKLLDHKNYDVVCDTAGSLKEAMSKLDSMKYDCIIADIGAGIEEGLSKLTALNAHVRPHHIPTIIYLDRDISTADEVEMKRVADVVVRKSTLSNNRLLDELELFLYKVQENKSLPDFSIRKSASLGETLQSKRVLLVDDDMRNVFALSAALENQQMEVITANDGKEAIAVLKDDKKIDIILMDVMMPEMDGFEAINIIRNEMKLVRLPIIALTAKAMSGDREKCLEAGASDYISKPVDIHKLASLMRVWVS